MIRIVIRINKDLLSDLDQDQGLDWDWGLSSGLELGLGFILIAGRVSPLQAEEDRSAGPQGGSF